MDQNSLVPGKTYFFVSYYDENFTIPKIETLIYVGKNLYPEEGSNLDLWYFQNPESFLNHGFFTEADESVEYHEHILEENMLGAVYDLVGLIDELKINVVWDENNEDLFDA